MASNNAPNDNPLLRDDVEIVESSLVSDESEELMISPEQEIEQKIDMLTEIDSLAVITKQQLNMRRQRIELEVENKKLDAAKKLIDGIEMITGEVFDAKKIKEIFSKDLKPGELSYVMMALEKGTNALKSLMNPNVLDEMGTKKKTKINFMFHSSGSVHGAI